MTFYHRRPAMAASVATVVAAAILTGCTSRESRVGEQDGQTVHNSMADGSELAAREIDPQADSILHRMCDTLNRATALRFRVDAAMDMPADTGQLAQFHRTSEIIMARPNRLVTTTESTEGHWKVWYQGKTLTILDRDANVYATESVPGQIDQMLDYMADEYDLVMPMADLLVGGVYDSLLADVESGSYLGLRDVKGTPCHHLLFRQENMDWQIWVDAGDRPLPRKLVITYVLEPDQPQYIGMIDGWDLSPATSEALFTFVPPAGSTSLTMAELVEDEE